MMTPDREREVEKLRRIGHSSKLAADEFAEAGDALLALCDQLEADGSSAELAAVAGRAERGIQHALAAARMLGAVCALPRSGPAGLKPGVN